MIFMGLREHKLHSPSGVNAFRLPDNWVSGKHVLNQEAWTWYRYDTNMK